MEIYYASYNYKHKGDFNISFPAKFNGRDVHILMLFKTKTIIKENDEKRTIDSSHWMLSGFTNTRSTVKLILSVSKCRLPLCLRQISCPFRMIDSAESPNRLTFCVCINDTNVSGGKWMLLLQTIVLP